MTTPNDALEQLAVSLTRRIERAVEHGQSLAEQIQTWLATEPVTVVPSIADDRLSWELRVSVDNPPPLEAWASIFDDAVHNLRSTLDNLAWGLASLDGREPSKPKSIYFPIVEKRENWEQERRKIAELPASAQAAIESIQPFQRSGADGLPENDALLLLNRLSNTGKHRFAIQPVMTPHELEHSFSVDFGSDEAAARNVPPDVTMSADCFVDNAVVIRQVTKTPIVELRGQYAFRGQVVVIDPVVGAVGVTSVLAELATYVPTVADYVLGSLRT